ncbi:DUF3489 domain-containing protein [Labrenzia sp. PHM005]|uniref:DUF3489 domain-containing protein n=1 Tax=Labrenzia sp. PHM005 TaxID=2590016 RepID=UPI0011405446|nr:DUF3489 domain-containing protein [Labrenzia sp. PHM005]QDG78530.1 DUF3489 domain-containing protein [Labrenzia sp. PHM005]
MNILPDWISSPRRQKAAPVPSKPGTALPSQPGSTIVVDSAHGQTNSPVPKGTAGQLPRPANAPFIPSARQLEILNLLAMPNGIRSSILAEKLGWKTPSVRAAISRLRAAGFIIETLSSATTTETVYRWRRSPVTPPAVAADA